MTGCIAVKLNLVQHTSNKRGWICLDQAKRDVSQFSAVKPRSPSASCRFIFTARTGKFNQTSHQTVSKKADELYFFKM